VLVQVLRDGDQTGNARRAAAQREADEAVLARPDLGLHGIADPVRVAAALPAVALHPGLGRVRHVGHQHELLQRDVDVLALAAGVALPEREQNARRRFAAAVVVRHRHGTAHRGAIGVAGHEEGAARRQRREVGAAPVALRSTLPVGRDRADDQARVEDAQRGAAETERVEPARHEALDQHVGLARQRAQAVGIGRLGQVEHQAALAEIARDP
jgi:hypothetical protein